MADGEAKLVVTLIDKASAGLKSLRAHWLAVTAALSTVTAFVVSSLKAFAEQEEAVAKLNNALKNQGVTSRAVTDELVKYASQLQKTSTFSDETIISSQALLTSFGLLGGELKSATKASVDLAAGLGIDLRSASLLVGKAFSGQTETLARYGIKIREGLNESEKFEAVLGAINARFGGAAQAQAETFGGKVTQLGLAFSDLKEEVGALLAGPSSEFLGWVTSAIRLMSELTAKTREYISVTSFLGTVQKLQNNIFKQIIEKQLENIGFTKAQSDENSKLHSKKVQELDAETQKFIDNKRMEVENYGFSEESKKLLQDEADALRLEKLGQIDLAEQLRAASMNAFLVADTKKTEEARAALVKKRVQVTQDVLSGLATFQNAKTKEIAAVAKTAAIAQATIDTYVGATAAYKAMAGIPIVGPALGMAAAAAAIATGLGRVAAISGVELAQGGIVMPTRGGTLATIGEGGRSEAVIPLGDSRATEQIRDAIGGETHISINAGVIVATDYEIEEFARRIDEKLYQFQRNRKSVL